MIEATDLTTTVLSDQQVEQERADLEAKKARALSVIAANAESPRDFRELTNMILGS